MDGWKPNNVRVPIVVSVLYGFAPLVSCTSAGCLLAGSRSEAPKGAAVLILPNVHSDPGVSRGYDRGYVELPSL